MNCVYVGQARTQGAFGDSNLPEMKCLNTGKHKYFQVEEDFHCDLELRSAKASVYALSVACVKLFCSLEFF